MIQKFINSEIDEIDKNAIKTQATTATMIITVTPNILNFSVFLSTIDQVILSNLQLQYR